MFDSLNPEIKREAILKARQRTIDEVNWLNEKIKHHLLILGISEEEALVASGLDEYANVEFAQLNSLIAKRNIATNFLNSVLEEN